MYRKLLSYPAGYGLLSALLLLLLAFPAPHALAAPYSIEISKSAQELLVKNGDEIVRRFRIATGKGGSGTKRHSGDNRTPVGNYKIVDFNANSRFHFFMQINYPNAIDAWHGYKNELISAREFKEIIVADVNNALPPQNTSMGGYIGLHGVGDITAEKLSIHDRHNWTEGCIALTNEEISDLRNYVGIGTAVHIRE